MRYHDRKKQGRPSRRPWRALGLRAQHLVENRLGTTVSVPNSNRNEGPSNVRFRKVVDEGKELNEGNALDSNLRTAEIAVPRQKLKDFVWNFLGRLTALDGANSSLHVFCRVDISVFINEQKKVTLFVNEVERGSTTCLWSSSGTSTVGQVGLDMAWPLAGWIVDEKVRLGIF